MNIKKCFFVLFTVVSAGLCHAQYGFYVDDFVLTNDDIGTVIQLPVKARFSSKTTSCFFRIQLPDGLELVYVEDEYGDDVFYTQGEDWPRRYGMDMIKLNNIYNFVLWNGENLSQRVQEAGSYYDMFSLYVRVNDDFSGGFIDISTEYVDCSRIVSATEWNYSQFDANNDGEINISDLNVIRNNILYEMAYSNSCDVNSDGRVDVRDLDTVVDYITASSSDGPFIGYQLVMTHNRNSVILEETTTSSMGDVNLDGRITIADVTTLIDYLLSGSW